jgi:uncharacterized protein
MRLVLDTDPKVLTVRRYAPGEIDVAGQLIRQPCLLSATQLITDWPVRSPAQLDLPALESVLALRPRILLIGADPPASRPGAALRRELETRGIALEMMDLGAACRTYNVLAQEHREVVAGLFP